MKPNRVLQFLLLVGFLLFFSQCATQQGAVQTPPPETAAPAAKSSVIQRVSFQEAEKFTRILVEGSEPIDLPFYKLLADPLRIAIDIPNVDLKGIKEPLKINNGTIGEVMTTQYDGKGRIEIGLSQMTNYNISKEGRMLTVDVEKVKRVEATTVQKKPESSVQVAEVPSPEVKKEEPVAPPAPPPAPPSEAVKKAKEVTDVVVEEKEGVVTFGLVADGKVENYNAFTLDSPARLVVDLWNLEPRTTKKTVKSQSPLVKQVRIGRYPEKLRFVFDAGGSKLAPYAIQPVDNGLAVSFGNVPPSSGPQVSVQGTEPASAPTSSANPGKTAVLTRIDFKQLDHRSRIAISSTGDLAYEPKIVSTNILVVDLKNAFIPKHLQRPLDTGEFESAVEYVTLENVKRGKANDARISIRLSQEVPYDITKEGRDIFIDIDKPVGLESKKEIAVGEVKKEEVKATDVSAAEAPKAEKEEGQPDLKGNVVAKKTPEEAGFGKVYSGRKISLDFKDADIKNILRLIAEVSDLNIIAGDDVTGKVTMRLVDVPWDQALDVVLQARSLGMSRVGNVIRVAPTDTLKKEIQGELEAKRAKEKLEDLTTELIPVNYASAKDIIPQVKSVLTERGDVKVDERTNILIVKDIPRNLASAKSLVKSLDTRTPQVMIEARIVEAGLSFQRELGVQWGMTYTTNGNVGSVTKGGNPNNKVVDMPAIARAGAAGALGLPGIIDFLFTSMGSLDLLDIAISAHEVDGDAKIISSPKIATLDNKQASIEQGLRIPYLKLTTEGTVTTDFIDANLKLTVTPHVTNDQNIKMIITVKKDRPDQTISVQGVPSIDKKEAITEVLVKDGGVVVIAGIYTIEKNDGMEGVPLFNKIPLLGWLFKREVKEDLRKDLLIFISPKILKDLV
jgi:type IV pilus assembly protein PilQ